MKGHSKSKHTTIRKPRLEDLESLLEIERRCFEAHRFDDKQFKYYIRNPSAIFAVAEHSNKLIGYVCGLVYHGRTGNTARLYSIAVLSRHRKRRIGAALLEYFEAEAVRGDCRLATLEVEKSNHAAVDLFQTFGYVRRQVLHDHYARGQHALKMHKFLK